MPEPNTAPCHNPYHAHLERADAVQCFADAADKAWADVVGVETKPGVDRLVYAARLLVDRTGATLPECAAALRASRDRLVERDGVPAETEADRLRAQVRAEVAEEIAQAIEAAREHSRGPGVWSGFGQAARIAREYAVKEG